MQCIHKLLTRQSHKIAILEHFHSFKSYNYTGTINMIFHIYIVSETLAFMRNMIIILIDWVHGNCDNNLAKTFSQNNKDSLFDL